LLFEVIRHATASLSTSAESTSSAVAAVSSSMVLSSAATFSTTQTRANSKKSAQVDDNAFLRTPLTQIRYGNDYIMNLKHKNQHVSHHHANYNEGVVLAFARPISLREASKDESDSDDDSDSDESDGDDDNNRIIETTVHEVAVQGISAEEGISDDDSDDDVNLVENPEIVQSDINTPDAFENNSLNHMDTDSVIAEYGEYNDELNEIIMMSNSTESKKRSRLNWESMDTSFTESAIQIYNHTPKINGRVDWICIHQQLVAKCHNLPDHITSNNVKARVKYVQHIKSTQQYTSQQNIPTISSSSQVSNSIVDAFQHAVNATPSINPNPSSTSSAITTNQIVTTVQSASKASNKSKGERFSPNESILFNELLEDKNLRKPGGDISWELFVMKWNNKVAFLSAANPFAKYLNRTKAQLQERNGYLMKKKKG
jgi:hypothetical protein